MNIKIIDFSMHLLTIAIHAVFVFFQYYYLMLRVNKGWYS